MITPTKSPPNSTSCQNGLMFTCTGKIVTNAAPTTGPSVVFIPPMITITRMFTETDQLNWLGETMPWNAKIQPAPPAIPADRPNIAILISDVRAPAAAANGSASRIASSTG